MSSEGGLGDDVVANEHIALHSAYAMTKRSQQLYTEQEGVARNDFLTELHTVYLQEVSGPALRLLYLGEYQQTATLCHGFNLKDSGITGSCGKCPWKKGSLAVMFFTPTILDGPTAIILSTSCIG